MVSDEFGGKHVQLEPPQSLANLGQIKAEIFPETCRVCFFYARGQCQLGATGPLWPCQTGSVDHRGVFFMRVLSAADTGLVVRTEERHSMQASAIWVYF